MGLLKRIDYSDSNILDFPNKEELLRVRNTADNLVNAAQKIIKTLTPSLMHPEILPLTDKDVLIGVREVARMLGVTERTVGRYREEGRIASINYTERKIMYRKTDILAFQNRKYKKPTEYLE